MPWFRYPSDGDDDGSSWNDLPAHIDSLDLNQANEAAFNDTFDGSISHDGLRVYAEPARTSRPSRGPLTSASPSLAHL